MTRYRYLFSSNRIKWLMALLGVVSMGLTVFFLNWYGDTHYPWRHSQIMVLTVSTLVFVVVFSVVASFRLPSFVLLSALGASLLFNLGVVPTYLCLRHDVNLKLNQPELLPEIKTSVLLGAGLKSRTNRDEPRPEMLLTLFHHFRERPEIPAGVIPTLTFPVYPHLNDRAAAFHLLNSSFRFWWQPPVILEKNLNWTEDPYDDGFWDSWNFTLHTMNYIIPLVRIYKFTGDTRYLQRAEDLVLDWISDNTAYYTVPPSIHTWYRHAIPVRAVSWVHFWEAWVKSELASVEEMAEILRVLLSHAHRLVDPESQYYREKHNHGIDQDIALITLSLVFPEFKASPRWLDLATKRLRSQVSETISARGVQLEHSPSYQITTLGHLTELLDLLRYVDKQADFRATLSPMLDNMASYATHIIQPNRHVTPLGDSFAEDVISTGQYGFSILNRYAPGNDGLQYILSNGAKGKKPPTYTVFEEEGYAFIQDIPSVAYDAEDTVYISFANTGREDLAHKHDDDLTFTLYACGEEIITDPGIFAYGKSPERGFVESREAHNTVVIANNRNLYRPRESFSSGAKRLRYWVDGPVFFVRGQHDLSDTAIQDRTLCYLGDGDFLIIDKMHVSPDRGARDAGDGKNAGTHGFEQLFHFGRNIILKPSEDGKTISLSSMKNPGETLVTMEQMRDTRLRVTEGERAPMQGWLSIAHHELVPAPVASFFNEDGFFITRLIVNNGRSGSKQHGGRKINMKKEGKQVTLSIQKPDGTVKQLDL